MKIRFNNIIFICCFLSLTAAGSGYAQPADNDVKLATHYYDKGEFEKAEVYYEKLYKQYKSKIYFDRYFMCLFYQQRYDECEDLAEKQSKRDPYDLECRFLLAMVYEETERQSKADEIYRQMIAELEPVQSRIDYLGAAFKQRGKYDLALETFLKGRDLLKKGYGFQLELAELYSLTNQPEKMIQEYLNLLDYSPSYLKTVQTYLVRVIDFTDDAAKMEMLKTDLLLRIQKNPEFDYYSEMLIWFYLQKKEFTGAVIQAKALDKRNEANGKRVFEVAQICQVNKAYDAAIKAYQYIIDLGNNSPYYNLSIEASLKIEFTQLTERSDYSQTDLNTLAEKYQHALTSLGKSGQTIGLMTQLAKIYVFYMNQPEKAEAIVKECLLLPINARQRAEIKILLGDIFVVSGRVWDASLLYMQVEKEFSEDIIGHEAKFKNARVFYYEGEFDYAKAQLDVLKASTSKLIANDAMQLSLLLQDNLGIDTTKAPVQMFANADLLIQQNRFPDALALLDSLLARFPFHSLADEVLFKKGEIFEQIHDWNKAIEFYLMVYDSYNFDILADDAVIRIARIYDFRLNDKIKASEYYKKVLFEFSASLHTAEARDRYNEIQTLP